MRALALLLALCLFPTEAPAIFSSQRGTVFKAGTAGGGGGGGGGLSGLIYVSNTSANSIPAGNDSGAGSASSPFATLDKAMSVANSGARIICNDGTYTPATFLTINKTLTIDSVTPYGCTLRSQTGQAKAILVSPPSSGSITIGQLLIDAHNDASAAIEIIDLASAPSLNLESVHVLNPVNYGVWGSGTATRVRATLNNFQLTGATTKSAYYLPAAAFSATEIANPTFAISGNIPVANQGIIHVSATAAGSTFSATNIISTVTTTSTSSAYLRTVYVENIPNALISGGTISITAASANVNCDGATVSFNPTTPIDSSGAIIESLTITHGCGGGGHGIMIGIDGDPGVSLRNYVNNGTIRYNHVTGTTASQAATLHGMLCGWQTGCTVERNSMDLTNLAYVIKGMTGATIRSNLATRTTGKAFYQKGGSAANFIHNTDYEQATGSYRPFAFYAGDDGSATGPATGMIVKGNVVDHEDATSSGTFISVETSSSATASYNDYYAAHARTFPWVYTGTNYATLAAWNAREATAIGNNPSLNTASANLPLLVQSSVVSRVSSDASAAIDYVGNSFNTTSAVGANETLYVPKDVADFTTITSLPAWITLTRASAGSYIGANGYIVSAATNAIRIMRDPITPFAQRGLLREPAGTNLFLQSQFASGWTLDTNATLGVDPDDTGPDNVAASGQALMETTSASSVHGARQSVNVTSGLTYTISVYAKPISGNGWLQIRLPSGQFGATTVVNYQLSGLCDIGTIGVNATGSGCIPMANGYYRLWVTAPATATAAASIIFYTEAANNTPTHAGIAGNGTYLWCAQMEEVVAAGAPTSCIATTTTTVTRAADVLALTGIGTTDEAAGSSSYFAFNPNTQASADAGFTAGTYTWPTTNLAMSNVTIYYPTAPPVDICPQGTGTADGCSGAVAGPANDPTLLNSYGANRPAWNVAGVDYKVGHSGTLANPSIGGTLPACATYSSAAQNTVTVNSAPCTIDHLDFTVNNGICLNVAGAAVGATVTITNNHLLAGPKCQPAGGGLVNVAPGGTKTVILRYNTFDVAYNNNFSNILNLGADGNRTVEYNVFLHADQHDVAFQGSGDYTVRYNYALGTGCCGNHGDWVVFNNAGGTTISLDEAFNTVSQDVTVSGAGAGATALCYMANNTGVNLTAAKCNNDTYISKLGNDGLSHVSYPFRAEFAGTWGATEIKNNWVDFTGSINWLNSTGAVPTMTCSGNKNLSTGSTLTGTFGSFTCS